MAKKFFHAFILILAGGLLAGCATSTEKLAFEPDQTRAIMRKVCDWQLANLTDRWPGKAGRWNWIAKDGWLRGTFYTGVMATWRATGDEKYFRAATTWARANSWKPGRRARHADDHCVGQTYLEICLARHVGDIKPIRKVFDTIAAEPRTDKRNEWWWCDALFMAPPVLARLAEATGERKYLDLMNRLWWETADLLYDRTHHLFYRDRNYLPGPKSRREKDGRPIFWSRGNGWVLAGLARVLQYMPADYPHRPRYERLMREMADKLAAVQGDDGLWRMNLVAGDLYPDAETSGTALLCFGLAWGVNNGILDQNKFTPVVVKAWRGLCRAVNEAGKLGWVQLPDQRPRFVKPANTMEYAAGAFLLAGEQMLKIRALPVVVAARQTADEASFARARANGEVANEGLRRCQRYVNAWLARADKETGLILRSLRDGKRLWNPSDAAADNYPFMVLTAALTDRELFAGRMLKMLRTETELTSRIASLPDQYNFDRRQFANARPNLDRSMFGASEYIKDGLLPLTEWLGPSPWSQRMLTMLDDMWHLAPEHTPYGRIVSGNVEINGEMLQTLARVYWMTGERKYLDWAIRLGDYYLLGDQHPTRNFARLRLRDHGCEIVSGLCELYATVHHAEPAKARAYRGPLHEMLDRILAVGRNEHGLFYDWVEPATGKHAARLADTWGYNLNGFYAVWLIDKKAPYRQAVRKALGNLNEHYRSHRWEGDNADGYADSIESCLNLYNRERIPSAAEWMDSEIRVMWARQQTDGVIEGWHGDGNFARTTIMYCLWKSRGVTIQPWRADVICGAERGSKGLSVVLRAERPWKGKLIFDAPRHKTVMRLPFDWPRINQFPEWFTVRADATYQLINPADGSIRAYRGADLLAGVPISLPAGREVRLTVRGI